jgi:hypothetical protein
MWKPLTSTQKVNAGNKIRFIHRHREYTEILFTVVKTHDHYFEILPIVEESDTQPKDFRNKVVKYFDIGYKVEIEVCTEPD